MTENDIEQAIGQHLAGMGSTPIAWPNADFTPSGTYIEFRHSPGERVDETIDGAGSRQIGIFLITVVTNSGCFNNAANALAQDIANRFPKALRIDVPSKPSLVLDFVSRDYQAGRSIVLFYAPSSLGAPFQDGAYWRQPVRVFYITE